MFPHQKAICPGKIYLFVTPLPLGKACQHEAHRAGGQYQFFFFIGILLICFVIAHK